MRLYLILLYSLLYISALTGQSGTNPFDIVGRVDSLYVQPSTATPNMFDVVRSDEAMTIETPVVTTDAADESDQTDGTPTTQQPVVSSTADELLLESNPFEVSHIPVRKSKLKEEADAFKQSTAAEQDSVQQAPSSNTFIFWLSLLAGVLLAVVINIKRNTVTRISKSLLNENILKYNHREEKQGRSGYYLLLYSVFFITASIFLYLVAIRYAEPTGMKTFALCAGAVLGAYVLKHIVLKCLGLVYPVTKESSLYGFTIQTFNICVGLLLLPLNLVIAFGPVGFSKVFLYLSFTMLVFLLILRSFRGMLIATSYIQKHIFHFFLYLCAVEIVPILVLLKILL